MNNSTTSRLNKIMLLAGSMLFCLNGLSAQDTCELFTPSGLRTFHEEHIDISKGLTAADSLHFLFRDGSLPVLEEFLAWGKTNGFSTAMEKGIIRDGKTIHFIKLTTVLDDLSFKHFTDIVEKVLIKKKELKMEDCGGAMGVGHP